jgi:hypothetical protein
VHNKKQTIKKSYKKLTTKNEIQYN